MTNWLQQSESFVEFTESELEQSIPKRFEQQVEKDPRHLAVTSRQYTITYEQLNRAANVLARAILSQSCQGQVPVALLLDNDAPMIEAILGVLKAAKIYVPLDPSLPIARLTYIFQDSQAALVLTNNRNAELAASLTQGKTLINIDNLDRHAEADNPGIPVSPDSLTWIIYTSGSTGHPKGVVQTHRNVLHFVKNYTNGLFLSSSDRLALLFSFGVNGAAHEMFSGLLNGATLHPLDIKKEGLSGLAGWLVDQQITTYSSVPTVFRHFCEALTGVERFPTLRFIKLVGEPVSKRDVDLYQKHFSSGCFLINRLGSTETGTIRWFFINTATRIDGSSVPVGYPVADNEVLLLDEEKKGVAPGEIGEIAVKSRYLSPGYWRKPEQTEKAFLTEPHSGDERIYLTGDLGRMLSDGCLLHMGRKDFQVKIRGHRIETAEIEMVLQRVSGARETIVMAREDASGEPRLVAYLLMPGQPAPSVGSLRRGLSDRLPEYMIPSAFVILDSFPTAPNGKVNRGSLPQPDSSRPGLENAFVSPSSSIEQGIARIWSEVLCVNPVGIHDNFFELGGHSLAAVQIVSRVVQEFQVELTINALFESPTVAEMAERLEFAVSEQNKRAAPSMRHAIARRKDRDFVPLSTTQEQMWFIDQLAPGSSAYNMAHAAHIKGTLNASALMQSIDEIVRRHESLRTTFTAIDGIPVQVTAPLQTGSVLVVDLATVPETDQMAEAMRLVNQEARHLFDLSKGPLVRFRLLRLSEEEHILLITVHHIVSDGWSWGVFLRELSALYGAFSSGKASPLAELPLQYADFAQWQHQWLQGDALEERLSYWKKRLDDAPSSLELPTDYPRPTAQTLLPGVTQSEMFSLDLTEKLRVLSRREDVTLFITLFAAFNLLLFRWTAQEDIVVGSAIAGRNREELEGLIGLFINTLVLRTDLSGNPTFRELLGRVRETALGAYANQEVPFDKLMERLQLRRSLSQGTLFQVLFVLNQDTWREELKLSGLTVNEVPVETGTVKFDLFVSMAEKADGLNCCFSYRTDLFHAATIRRMTQHLGTLLDGIVKNPDARLSELPVLSNTERMEMVVGWNDTKAEYPQRCVHELFEEQVLRTPQAIAVVHKEDRLSYQELDSKANQLAHYLQALGVRPGVSVAICMERSLEMMVAVLGVLKAGGAYVPLDPKYSIERLAWVLKDSEAPLLLSQQRTAKNFDTNNVKLVCLDSEWEIISQESEEKPALDMTPDDLVYVIYTSGSTGRPKGVEITHRSLVNFVTSAGAMFELEPTDRVLQFHSISFDVASEEIFPCLARGAMLILRTDSMLDSVSFFLQQCRDWGITILDLPTAYWHELTDKLSSEKLTLPQRLRLVIIGGEKAIPERLAQWQRCSGGSVRLFNEYGPTETTVWATKHELSGAIQDNESPRAVPIGRPISNVQTYVLDRYLNPVPIGVFGGLYIGGVGLARGYHKRPELTAECFIPDPFGNVPGGRLYKTGDLVRYLPDRTLEFIGRLDHQVKVRGFRVEPGEIEAVLTEHAMVRQVVVVAEAGQGGDNRLLAYVVLDSEFQATAQDLRDFLRKRLPDYMVPAAFIILDVLPLTPSGKVDRHALPQLDQKRLESQPTVAPQTTTQQQLAEEWEDLLDVQPIGIRDNFFDLGGHSLLGVRLIARIEKRFGKNLPVAVLFQSPTIEQLAVMLEKEVWSESWSSLIPVQPNGSKLPFFWIHGDSSNAILSGYLGPDQPIYGVEHQGQDGKPARYTEVEKIAEHYIREVRTVSPCGPYLLGGYSFGAIIAFEMAQQLRRRGEPVALLFMLDPPGKIRKNTSSLALPQKIRRHSKKLAHLEPQDLDFLLHKVRERIYARTEWLRKDIGKLRWKASLAVGRLLPPSLRTAYIFDIYRRALRSYVPQEYSGPVTLFKTEGDCYQPRLDWMKLITGDIELHEGVSRHHDLKREPYVSLWVGRLKESLDRAHESIEAANHVVEA